MSEQAKILTELEEIIMNILKNGAATAEEGARIDELEALLLQQKCYKEIDHETHSYQGEEIAALLATNQTTEAIDKMCSCEITPEDFFGFIAYHDEDEEYAEIFTPAFSEEITKLYQTKC